MNWLEIAGFLVLGFAAGTYGTLIGVGGGLVMVPVLIFLHASPKEAAGTSMAAVLANAVSGSISYLRRRRIQIPTGFLFAAAGVPGAILGALLDQYIPRRVFGLLFAALLVFMGARLLLARNANGHDARELPAHISRGRQAAGMCIAFVAGFVASVFGVGGGIIYVPTMLSILQFPAHIATATSTFIIALTAIFATASHAHYHDILWVPAAALAAGAVGGAQVGAVLHKRIAASRLVKLFALGVLLTAAYLIYKSI